MLKDKYTFKYGLQSIDLLEESLTQTINFHTQMSARLNKTNLNEALILLNIYPLTKRLGDKIRNYRPCRKIHFSVKPTEALALHVAYSKGLINTKNHLIQEIFTAIDKTL